MHIVNSINKIHYSSRIHLLQLERGKPWIFHYYLCQRFPRHKLFWIVERH